MVNSEQVVKPPLSTISSDVVIDESLHQLAELIRPDVDLALQIFRVAHPLRCPGQVLFVRVWVTADYEGAVRSLRQQYESKARRPYVARRETGMAVGTLVMVPSSSQVSATIVLDGHSWQYGVEPAAVFMRLSFIVHEFMHLLLEAERRFKGQHQLPPAGERSFEETFWAAAELNWEEFQVDLLVDSILRNLQICKGSQGETLSTGDLNADGYEGMVRELLRRCCLWVVDRVERYRVTEEGLLEIWNEGIPRVEELFVTLSHLMAAYAATDRIDDLHRALTEEPGFIAYLDDDWKALCQGFKSNRVEAREQLSRVMIRTMRRLGFAGEETPGRGLYIHVFEPRWCSKLPSP